MDDGSMTISDYVRAKRHEYHLTQVDLSMKTGVGLRFFRELEAGKETVHSS